VEFAAADPVAAARIGVDHAIAAAERADIAAKTRRTDIGRADVRQTLRP
jgi:hypothetical protein